MTHTSVPHFLSLFICRKTLGGVHSLAVVDRAAVKVAEQVSMGQNIQSFGPRLRSGLAGSYDRLSVRCFEDSPH